MSGFGILLRKELLEAWRTRRLPVVAVLFLIVGIISPLTARYLNEILTLAMGDSSRSPCRIQRHHGARAAPEDLGQLGALAAIALAMGSVSGELDRGTAAMVLAQPVGRPAFLAAKLLAIAAVLGIATLLASAVAWIYTAVLFEPLPIGGWLAMAVLSWLALTAWAALTFSRPRPRVPRWSRRDRVRRAHRVQPARDRAGDRPFLPTGLAVPAIALAAGGGAAVDGGRLATAVIGTVALCLAALAAAVVSFRRREL